MVDCIIIGAGVAGSSVAYHLAKQGHDVQILEKASFPRSKGCGGGVSPAIAQWFDFDFSPVIAAKVDKVRFTWQGEDPIETKLATDPVWMVKRDRFDVYLLEKAQEAGAKFQDNAEVQNLSFNGSVWQLATSQGTLEAPYIIAADGASGPSAKWLGLKDRKPIHGGILTVNKPPSEDSIAQFDFGSVKNGFIWNFPTGDSFTLSAALMTGKGKPQDLQKQLIAYAESKGLAVDQNNYRPVPITLWSDQPLHGQNALLVGDSAGLADPLIAEGIRPSILSGVKASEAVHQALTGNGEAIAQYTDIMQEVWGNDMNLAQKLSGLFYKFPKIAYKVGVKRPAAAKIMSQILVGELRYSDVTDQAIKVLKKSFLPGGK